VLPLHWIVAALFGWLQREQHDVIEFLRAHWRALWAADFFTTEVWTVRGLVTYYTELVIELHSRRVHVLGSTPHPDEAFVVQRCATSLTVLTGCSAVIAG
jgi:hypothetical protein